MHRVADRVAAREMGLLCQAGQRAAAEELCSVCPDSIQAVGEFDARPGDICACGWHRQERSERKISPGRGIFFRTLRRSVEMADDRGFCELS